MKMKNLTLSVLILLLMLMTVGVGRSTAQSQPQPASPFPRPVGAAGTIVKVQGNFFWVKTQGATAGRVLQFKTDATTAVIKGGFVNASALSMGDTVIVNPAFPASPSSLSAPAGVPGSTSAGPTTGGDANSGRRNGSSDTTGSTSTTPPAGVPGSGQNTSPSAPTTNNGGRRDSSAAGPAASVPAQGAPSDRPGGSTARNDIPVARLVWVPQAGQTLTAGVVTKVSNGVVTLKSGALNFTATLDRATAFRQVATVGGPVRSAVAADVQQGKTLVVLGSASGNSAILSAKAVLIMPTPGTSTARP